MSLRMPLNYSDATEMDGNLNDANEEVMRGRSAPGRDVEGLKRDLGQAEMPSGTNRGEPVGHTSGMGDDLLCPGGPRLLDA